MPHRDLQMISEANLGAHHVADRDDRKPAAIRLAVDGMR